MKKISIVLIIIMLVQIISPICMPCLSNKTYATTSNKEQDVKYMKIYNELEDILNQKKWGQQVNDIFIDGLDSLWNSYEIAYNSFSVMGYPSKEMYIKDNYIEPLKKLSYVHVCESDEEMLEKIGDSMVEAYTSKDEKGNEYMVIKNPSIISKSYDEYINTIQHEVRHIVENKVYEGEEYFFLLKTFSEGWAVLGEINQYKDNSASDVQYYSSRIKSDKENYYVIVGGIGPVTEYALCANAMLKLTIIVGYDNMLKFEKGEITYKELINLIYNKLGNETAEKFIDGLKHFLNYEYDYSIPGFQYFEYKEDTDINKIIDLENIILTELKSGVSNCNSKQEVQSYLNFYYLYKKFYCIKYQEIVQKVTDVCEGGQSIEEQCTDYSESILMISEIEKLLIEKIKEFNAVSKVSDNDILNQNVIKSLFVCDDKGYYSGPLNLHNQHYTYSERTEQDILKGYLQLNGVEISFDEKGNIAVKYVYPSGIIGTTKKILNYESEIKDKEEEKVEDKVENPNNDANKEDQIIEEKIYTYRVLEGTNQTYKNEDLTVKFDAPVEELVEVSINGNKLDAEYYTATKGSTVLTVSKTYLKTLKSGTYTLVAKYENGEIAQTTFVVAEAQDETKADEVLPQTGVFTAVTCVALAFLAGMVYVFYNRYKRIVIK